ncbi:hypothetical protein ACYDHR_10425 [Klebsiella aerogenes]|uniref:hypothetical protein n=3 Tax=Enterobacteriaceae TaxID=543 RepID=UPI001989BCB8|nr:hypothetical protein [Salmonella enterica]EKW3880807.1 hypothetical protein [Klebsiella aerogenes]ELR0646353.1 hypothetical protein [Enterobacter hormaechei]EGA3853820.1 hypothetical protein [Salmonella enterica]EGK8531658.1 hypothetical protein [Salmonella enterica]
MRLSYSILSSILCLASSYSLAAQEHASDAAQANNPLANMTAFNMQNYYIGDVSGTDQDANQFWFRYAQPFSLGDSKWLLRGSLPINTYPVAPTGGHKTGLGDLNIFASWLIDTGNPAVSFGFGPQITAPTATEDALGTEKWSAGLVNVLFDASSPKFQYGYLASWQHSFAGEDNRNDVNLGTFQPFLFYQLGGGTYLRAAPIWVYNFQNDSYSVPLGLGIGQVIKQDKTVYNFFVEPQGSVADRGPGQPHWQIFFGLNLQFLN